jgi:hypothetical protein
MWEGDTDDDLVELDMTPDEIDVVSLDLYS